MSDPNRRQTLQGLGALAGLAATGASLPGCGATDADTPAPEAGSIDTLVVLMMENRSFDHYFGALTLEEGRTDVDGLTAEMFNEDLDGKKVHAFKLHEEGCLEDPPHGWGSSHAQHNGGACDGFVKEHAGGRGPTAEEAIGYHNRDDLPVYYALADDNVLCDRWFASVMGPTWPNRFYALAGTSDGMPDNDFARAPSPLRTIFDQLEDAGVSWRIYYSDTPFGALFESLGGVFGGRMSHVDEFFVKAERGQLEQVVFVDPAFLTNDDHPPHPPILGQLFVGTVYEALARSPQWGRSLMIVDYDEHGGFFDHVSPPKVEDDHADDGFDQLGFRVPALVLGPYARSEVVHTQYDHTSVLTTIQEHFGIEERLSARNAGAEALWDCIDLDRLAANDPRPATPLPTITARREDFGRDCFYLDHPGQVELEQLFDEGVLPARFDARDRVEETVGRMLLRAEKFGLLRIVD